MLVLSVFTAALTFTAQAAAQPASTGPRLLVTVIDQTGAVLPNATVTISGEDDATRSISREAATSKVGVAVFEALAQGRYTVQAVFPAFQQTMVRGVRVRNRDNRLTITLQLEKLDETLNVGRDAQSSALDAQGAAFSTVLTREMIDALPDDPEDLERVLQAMAPPGATIRIDGFTGGKMPPKSQIRSIRLPRMDMFAAQNHGGFAGALFIDILTQPGAGPLRGNADFNFLDDTLNARNALTPRKGDEQLRQYGTNLSGTIRPSKTSFSLSAGGATQYFSSNLLAVLPDGDTRAEALKQPQTRASFTGRLDHAINKDHALRAVFERTTVEQRNLGIGDFNLPERGFTSETTTNMLRFSENGPVGKRAFSETRLQLRWSDAESRSALEAPTIRVNDAFTSGGAQIRGGRRDVTFEFASDLDYVRGPHSWRTGVLFEGGRHRSDDMSNYLGTYTFASLSDYLARRPSNYTRRIGDPNVTYSNLQAAVYVQDDYRVARSLLLSAGVRYGYENLVHDGWNLSPRVTAAWSPLRNGKLTLRANYGYFYDWIAGDTYKQTLVIDGFRQREINVRNPDFLESGLDGAAPPTNRYLWSDDLTLPNMHRLSVGLDRRLTQTMGVSVAYNSGWGRGLLRPRNLNAPADGMRPDPAFANIVQIVTDAASRQQALNFGWNLNLMTTPRRMMLFVNYTLSKNESNTAGPFALLANGDALDLEWGPGPMDARHRIGSHFNMQPFRNFNIGVNTSYRSGTPYNITTGGDDNGDGAFSDRPAGVTRNAARGAAVFDLGGRVSYTWGFGPRRREGAMGGGQVVIVQGGGDRGAGPMAPGFGGNASDRRFRLEFYASTQNLMNRTNYTAYSGVMTSPLFGQPTGASAARRVQVGARFGF
ncbi:MAG: TonB-dependent receptor [Acidobacteria bacterium]|nr:TonB-dependent receptor [Acidobacteriota bacterium]